MLDAVIAGLVQVYGRNVLHRRDSLAVLSAIGESYSQRSALDNEDAWPGWMSNKALFILPPEHPWRRDIAAAVTHEWYKGICGIVVAISILGVFLTPQAQLTPAASTKVQP